ncbi:MAG: DUF1543 domain-containing protein [Chitinophagaceae bacterium]
MPKLFMVLIGCKPPGRHIEQHDVFFGIGESMADLVPNLVAFWSQAAGKLHIDAWREITQVDKYSVKVTAAGEPIDVGQTRLYFINLGGYKENEFEEFHYKMLIAANSKAEAINKSKQTAFFRHTGFKGASSHIDDKYGIDVDDLFEIEDALDETSRTQYRILLSEAHTNAEDEIHLGYFKLGMFR